MLEIVSPSKDINLRSKINKGYTVIEGLYTTKRTSKRRSDFVGVTGSTQIHVKTVKEYGHCMLWDSMENIRYEKHTI